MKKRVLCLLICLFVIAALAGCGNSNPSGRGNRQGGSAPGVNDVLQAGVDEENSKKNTPTVTITPTPTVAVTPGETTPEPTGEPTPAPGAEGVDVDLTVLSSTLVYTEVYNMMTAPENYLGKTVRMKGSFAVYYDEEANVYYYACLISDATACCQQGIEFELTGEHAYPADYPALGSEICVEGIFDTYQEGNYTYCTLRKAKMVG